MHLPRKHLHPCGLLSDRWPTGQVDDHAPVAVLWRSLLVRQKLEDDLRDALAEDLLACKHAKRYNRWRLTSSNEHPT